MVIYRPGLLALKRLLLLQLLQPPLAAHWIRPTS